MMQKIDLKKHFLGLQKQMTARLMVDRESISHPGTKGDASELNWIEWLRAYLPKRYNVGKAFIIDCKGNMSDQIDVVIYDQQYSPFVFNQDGAIYIPAESVYAIFEVKQELNKENIIYTGEKMKSVRLLHRTSANIYHAGGKYKPKTPFKILSGILTLTSTWNPPLGDSFDSAIKGLEYDQSIDIGCVLKDGSFKVKYDNGVIIQKSNNEESLIFFFLNLLMELQRMATTPAIDIKCYIESLDSI
jgi:hypothetical protein